MEDILLPIASSCDVGILLTYCQYEINSSSIVDMIRFANLVDVLRCISSAVRKMSMK